MAKLIVMTKGLSSSPFELGMHWVTIGRAPTNTFQILEASVSGQHCEVLLRGEELIVRDMRSTNNAHSSKGRWRARAWWPPGKHSGWGG